MRWIVYITLWGGFGSAKLVKKYECVAHVDSLKQDTCMTDLEGTCGVFACFNALHMLNDSFNSDGTVKEPLRYNYETFREFVQSLVAKNIIKKSNYESSGSGWTYSPPSGTSYLEILEIARELQLTDQVAFFWIKNLREYFNEDRADFVPDGIREALRQYRNNRFLPYVVILLLSSSDISDTEEKAFGQHYIAFMVKTYKATGEVTLMLANSEAVSYSPNFLEKFEYIRVLFKKVQDDNFLGLII